MSLHLPLCSSGYFARPLNYPERDCQQTNSLKKFHTATIASLGFASHDNLNRAVSYRPQKENWESFTRVFTRCFSLLCWSRWSDFLCCSRQILVYEKHKAKTTDLRKTQYSDNKQDPMWCNKTTTNFTTWRKSTSNVELWWSLALVPATTGLPSMYSGLRPSLTT